MALLEITAESSKRVLGAGTHLVTVVALAKALSKKGTKQIKATYESENGTIDIYHTIESFEKDANGVVITNSKGERKVSKSGSDKAIGILRRLAFNCGIPKGTKLDLADLKGKQVKIVLEMEKATEGSRAGEEFARFQYSLPVTAEPQAEVVADDETF